MTQVLSGGGVGGYEFLYSVSSWLIVYVDDLTLFFMIVLGQEKELPCWLIIKLQVLRHL